MTFFKHHFTPQQAYSDCIVDPVFCEEVVRVEPSPRRLVDDGALAGGSRGGGGGHRGAAALRTQPSSSSSTWTCMRKHNDEDGPLSFSFSWPLSGSTLADSSSAGGWSTKGKHRNCKDEAKHT